MLPNGLICKESCVSLTVAVIRLNSPCRYYSTGISCVCCYCVYNYLRRPALQYLTDTVGEYIYSFVLNAWLIEFKVTSISLVFVLYMYICNLCGSHVVSDDTMKAIGLHW
jgi:hypothetical protein